MFVTCASLSVMAALIVAKALPVLEKIAAGGGEIDSSMINTAVNQAATSSSDSPLFNGLLLLVLICWILAVVDAYRIGGKMDLSAN